MDRKGSEVSHAQRKEEEHVRAASTYSKEKQIQQPIISDISCSYSITRGRECEPDITHIIHKSLDRRIKRLTTYSLAD